MGTNNVKLLHRDLPIGILWSMWYPKNITLAVEGLCVFQISRKSRGRGMCVKNMHQGISALNWIGRSGNFS